MRDDSFLPRYLHHLTHDLLDLSDIADRACLLEKGKIALTGSAQDVM
jgi:ABC-type transporter Mla maintaining outer membrane lipid asymmetry ATPase subunit MlaF